VTPDRWRRIKGVLASALEREPDQRGRFVLEACADDERLRNAVESLIRADAHDLIPREPGPPPARARLPRLETGGRVGAYEVRALLAAGGMGEVYRALDTRLGRDVALKTLPEACATDPARVARFEREARAAAALNHPNIVTLYSLEEEDGLRFLTMELVRGRTLGQAIPPGGCTAEALVGYALPLTDALAAAHARGIVHRDLKPGNVMLSHDGCLKLLDFGLATIAAGREAFPPLDRDEPLTRDGLLVGTSRYMSPEQLKGQPLDCGSDVFALGVVLYELAADRTPFGGATPAETCSAVLRDPAPPLRRFRPDLAPALCDPIMRCLEKDPRRRFASAAEVLRELAPLARTSGARPPTPAGSLPEQTVQEEPCLLPMAFDGALGHASHGCNLREAEPAEEPQVDQLGERRVERRHLVEGGTDLRELGASGRGRRQLVRERADHEMASPLLCLAPADVVDQQAAHHLCGVAHEAGAVRKGRRVPAVDVEVGLVQEGRGAERQMTGATRELAAREPVELGVQRREERVGGGVVTALGGRDQPGKLLFQGREPCIAAGSVTRGAMSGDGTAGRWKAGPRPAAPTCCASPGRTPGRRCRR
jgi:serine/threonine protein kinase